MRAAEKHQLVRRLIAAKEESGLTLDDIGEKLGVTNVFAGQVLHNQVRQQPKVP
jgi:cyanate lyase